MSKPIYLTEKRWNSMKKKNIVKPMCSICLMPIIKLNKWDRLHKGLSVVDVTVQPYLTLECKHKFHSKCILKWFENQGTCPICRHQIIKI